MKALPSDVIERIFARLNALYGAQFTRQWAGLSADTMKRTWARELAGFEPTEILWGLEQCRDREFPPTVPEFRNLCRPTISPEAAFFEATKLWPIRDAPWSSPAVYWAALAVGDDVRKTPWHWIKARWTAAYDYARAHPRPIPPPAELPKLEDRRFTEEERNAAAERVLSRYRT